MDARTDALRIDHRRLIRELSDCIPCDRRTVRKALAGGKVARLRFLAIERALTERGLQHLLQNAKATQGYRTTFTAAQPDASVPGWWLTSSTTAPAATAPAPATETQSYGGPLPTEASR